MLKNLNCIEKNCTSKNKSKKKLAYIIIIC